MTLLGIGKRDEAALALSTAIGLREQLAGAEPGNLRYQTDLVMALIAMGDLEQEAGPPDEARRWRQRAEPILVRMTGRRSGDLWLWRNLGWLHADLGRTDEAATDFERVMGLVPRTANDRNFASPRSEQIREMAAHAEAFARLLERHPDDGSLWCGRGRYSSCETNGTARPPTSRRGAESAPPPQSEEWLEHAALRLLVGDTAGYRDFVRECIRREGDTSDPLVGYVLARVCNLRRSRWPTRRGSSDGRRSARSRAIIPGTACPWASHCSGPAATGSRSEYSNKTGTPASKRSL